MADSSFDVVSKIDRMELDNAINQAIREIDTRFDFKNTGAKIEMAGEKISIEADTEERAKATLDVVKDKMIKRGVSLKHIDPAEPQLSGKIYKISCPLKEGISTENAKKIAKFLRDEGPKSWFRSQVLQVHRAQDVSSLNHMIPTKAPVQVRPTAGDRNQLSE